MTQAKRIPASFTKRVQSLDAAVFDGSTRNIDINPGIPFFNVKLKKVKDHGMSRSMMPCFLAIRDENGKIFGAYLSEAPNSIKGYYGNGQWYIIRLI